MRVRELILLIAWLLGALTPAIGQESSAPKKEPGPTVLTLEPAAAPRPALKYRLLPEGPLNQKPGNAAVHYGKAAMLLAEKGAEERSKKIADWLAKPLAEMPRDEAKKTLTDTRLAIEELALAARRERCDWDLPIREKNFLSLALPEMMRMRDFGRLIALQARLAIADRRFDDAMVDLQTGFALARQTAENPTLIGGLVGMAISDMMVLRVREWIEQPKSPNLYWALSSLPRPMIDLRRALETEMQMVALNFPEIQKIDPNRPDQAYWQNWLDKVEGDLKEPGVEWPKLGFRAALTVFALHGYPIARDALIAEGRSRAEVEAMPVPAVLALYSVQTYNDMRDDVFRWFYLAYPEAREGFALAERRLKEEASRREIYPIASMLVPAVVRVAEKLAEKDRMTAALRTVEAIRLYGAAHGGKLPENLNDVREAPVPNDPMTGKAFGYRRTGDRAILEALGPSSENALRWELHFTNSAK